MTFGLSLLSFLDAFIGTHGNQEWLRPWAGEVFWLWEYFANLLPNRRFLTLLVFLWIFLIMGCIFPLDFFLCTRESGVVFICFIPPTTTPGWSCVFSRTRWSFIFFLTLAPNLCPQSICSLILIPFDFDLALFLPALISCVLLLFSVYLLLVVEDLFFFRCI